MDVLIVLVFVSLVLVAAALVLLVFSLRQQDFEHADRLSLLPLGDVRASSRVASNAPEGARESPVPGDSSRP